MVPTTPYSGNLAGRDAGAALRDTPARIDALTRGWTPGEFDRTYATGKWSARQILTHLAHTEMALGTRARMALTTPGYVAQPFEQDAWMLREDAVGGLEALGAFLAVAGMNAALFGTLSDADRGTTLSHPEFGMLTVDWIIHQLAGHQIHHHQQLTQIAGV